MLSFKTISYENAELVIKELSASLSMEEREALSDIVNGILSEDNEDIQYALSVGFGCAFVRIFDTGRYLFLFPCELSDEGADMAVSIDAISEYAMREELPLVFCGVPASALTLFCGFRHLNIDAEDEECSFYKISVQTECMLLNDIPSMDGARVKLNALCENDKALYAKLCKDENVNKYWGYDYSLDNRTPDDSYFISEAAREFSAGMALSLAVRLEGRFAGQTLLYAFDGKGSAEFAIRLLPEFQGLGVASEAFMLISKIALGIGLVSLRAEIMKENKSSLSFAEKNMRRVGEGDDRIYFEYSLY